MKKKLPSLYQDRSQLSKMVTNTNFNAIKKLHETETQLEALKNRLRVIQSNDRNNQLRIANHMQKIEKLKIVRENHIHQIKKMNVTKQQQQKFLEELKQKNQIKRRLMKDKMGEVMDEIALQKARQHLQICQQRELIESRISQNRQKQLSKKQFHRNKIVQSEEQGKQKYNQFLESKIGNILKSNQQEANKINKKRVQKELQLQKMSNLESQLLRKHSESQMAYHNMKEKLDNMLGASKFSQAKQNTMRKSKLSHSVHSRAQKENKVPISRLR